jgi:hypothetical protein
VALGGVALALAGGIGGKAETGFSGGCGRGGGWAGLGGVCTGRESGVDGWGETCIERGVDWRGGTVLREGEVVRIGAGFEGAGCVRIPVRIRVVAALGRSEWSGLERDGRLA